MRIKKFERKELLKKCVKIGLSGYALTIGGDLIRMVLRYPNWFPMSNLIDALVVIALSLYIIVEELLLSVSEDLPGGSP